jgi:hypothetical protein
MQEHEAFLRSAAVTSVLDAALLSTSSAKIGRALGEGGPVPELSTLTERLAEFLRFVTLAEAALADGEPDTATWLGGFAREILATCERITGALERHDLERVRSELDWISAILGDYPTLGGEVAIALRHRFAPAA